MFSPLSQRPRKHICCTEREGEETELLLFTTKKKKSRKKRFQATVQAGRCPIRMAGVRDWRAAGLFVPKLPEFLGYAAS